MKVKSKPYTFRFNIEQLDTAVKKTGLKPQQLFDKLLSDFIEKPNPNDETPRYKIVNGKKVFK